MHFIVGGRRSGKTHATLRWFAADPIHRGVVCINYQEAQRFIQLVRASYPDLRRDNSWTANVFGDITLVRRGRYGRRELEEIVIDNLDMILSQITGVRPRDIRATTTDDVTVGRPSA